MSIACKCDRCGKLFEMQGDRGFHIPAIEILHRDLYRNSSNDTKTYELCYECYYELNQWIEKGDLKNGRNICTGPAEERTAGKRRKTRKTDSGDTPDSE